LSDLAAFQPSNPSESTETVSDQFKSMNLPVRSTEPLYALTSMRFFGSLAVFFFHALEVCLRNLETINFGSASAVSLFFVLSGFILVYIYSGKIGSLGVFGFWAKRFARLWPLHLACLILVLIFQYRAITHWSGLLQMPDFISKLVLNAAMLQNWVPKHEWAFSFNGVSWFVATEFSFCLLFPFLVRVGPRRFIWVWLTVLLLHLAGLWIANRYYLAQPELRENFFILIQCNPLFRLLEFTSGMGIGFIFTSGYRLPAGRFATVSHTLIEILVLSFFALSLHIAPLGKWLYWLAYGIEWNTMIVWLAKGGSSLPASLLMIWVFASSKGLFGKLLSHPLFVYLGKISYSFYMIHYLVLYLVRASYPELNSPVLAILCSLAISIACAGLLNLLVETPGRSGLLYLLDPGQRSSREDSYTGQPIRKMLGTVVVSGLISLLGCWGLWMESRREKDLVVPENRQIVFKGEAVLHQVEASADEEGLTLVLTWEKLPQHSGLRFMHLLDQDEQLISQYPVNAQLFKQGRIGVERVVIPSEKLENVAGIAIGFFNPESQKTSQFFNRSRNFQGWRLTVYDCQQQVVPVNVRSNTKEPSLIKAIE
jgi:peptidoglycan/LPS O-acetylase OafA/YrhL